MSRLLFTIWLLSFTMVKGQQFPTWNCNESNLIPNTIFYPNTSTTYSNNSIDQECMYLCGPNTVVYDTFNLAPNYFCRTVLVNSGCTYYTANVGCAYLNVILAKNNSTVVLMPNANVVTIEREPNATIVVQCSSCIIQTYTCTSITFTTVNCARTNVLQNNSDKQTFKVWPNPTSTKINIEFSNYDDQTADIRITNQMGQIVFESKNHSLTNKEIPIDNLPDGLYLIYINTKSRQQTEKIVILR